MTDRAAVTELCRLDEYVDVMIPRGGESLVRAVCAAATMPVLKHYMGVCHLYVDEGADPDMALALAFNGKSSAPAYAMRWNACWFMKKKLLPSCLAWPKDSVRPA